jgi:hypothetical protein
MWYFAVAEQWTRPCQHTICPADNATAGSLGRRRAGQLRFGFVAVLEGHIVCNLYQLTGSFHMIAKKKMAVTGIYLLHKIWCNIQKNDYMIAT